MKEITNQDNLPPKESNLGNQASNTNDFESLNIGERDYNEEVDEGFETMDDENASQENISSNSTTNEKNNDMKSEKKSSEGDSSPHDGKYFVIQKGMCQCNQGFKFPKFKVTSHQKHYWNDEEGNADYLAVTEDDLTLDPPAIPFGNCKLRPTSGGYLPCAYAPAGKWQKTYEKVKVMGKSCVTEISELMCSTGGKITILKHGQQSEAGKSNVMDANSQEQHIYNPLVNFDEFKAEVLDENEDDLDGEPKVW